VGKRIRNSATALYVVWKNCLDTALLTFGYVFQIERGQAGLAGSETMSPTALRVTMILTDQRTIET
jgi:hypothetical protein